MPLEALDSYYLVQQSSTRPGVTYEKIGAGYATELMWSVFAEKFWRRRAHEIVERQEKRKKKVRTTWTRTTSRRAIKERDGKVKKGPPKGHKKRGGASAHEESSRFASSKIITRRRHLLRPGRAAYVQTMLSDVEF